MAAGFTATNTVPSNAILASLSHRAARRAQMIRIAVCFETTMPSSLASPRLPRGVGAVRDEPISRYPLRSALFVTFI